MARIPRKYLKIFASSAINNGVFGSAADNTKILSNDVEVIQSKPAWLTGWLDAVIKTRKFPTLEEFQSCNYVNTHQLAYLFQEGIPEWDVNTPYFQRSIVRKTGTYEIYGSLTDNNIGNAVSNTANWEFLIDLSLSQQIPYGVTIGAANAYSVATSPVFDSLADGSPFIIKANHSNTGPSTLNPNSIGALNIFANGAALSGGEIVSGAFYILVQDSTNNRAILLNPSNVASSTNVKGIIEIATPAEMVAQSSQVLAATPYNVNQLFAASGRQSLATNGFQIFPGGLKMQWGSITVPAEGTAPTLTVTFPSPFTSSVYSITGSTGLATRTDSHNFVQVIGTPTLTDFVITNQWISGSDSQITVRWMALGI